MLKWISLLHCNSNMLYLLNQCPHTRHNQWALLFSGSQISSQQGTFKTSLSQSYLSSSRRRRTTETHLGWLCISVACIDPCLCYLSGGPGTVWMGHVTVLCNTLGWIAAWNVSLHHPPWPDQKWSMSLVRLKIWGLFRMHCAVETQLHTSESVDISSL